MNADEIQNILITANLIATMGVTCWLQYKSKREDQKRFLDNQLAKLQELSFEYPFLEDEKFTKEWNNMKKSYNSKSCENKCDFLRYDVYTEMLFNFIAQSFIHFKTEEKLMQYIDFKTWVRMHATCWQNPLSDHSNRDTYGDKFCDMIDRWIK